MAITEGYGSVQESLADGASLSNHLVVEADFADTLYVYVTDGSGSAPSESYDLTVEVKKGTPHDSNNDTKWFEETNISTTGSTSKRHSGSISGGAEVRVNLTNVSDSGSSQTYEVIAHARSEGTA